MEKTYATTYQLIMDSPDVVRCKQAREDLYEVLCRTIDREAITGVGICLNVDRTGPAIAVRLRDDADVRSVPTLFAGFEVSTEVTGVIRAL